MILYANVAMAAILVDAMLIELRTGRIPNWLTLLPVALFVVVIAMADDRVAMLYQLALAAGVFVIGLLSFASCAIGAGAVKLIAGLSLFIPLNKAFYTLLIFFAVFFVGAFFFVQIRKRFGSEESSWYVMAKAVIPRSFPICIAGLFGLFIL